jgi:hypothetical protein
MRNALSKCVVVETDRKDESALIKLALVTPEGERLWGIAESPDALMVDARLEGVAVRLEKGIEEYPRRREGFLDFLFSHRAVTDEDRRAVARMVEKLGDDDVRTRERATAALVAHGFPALMILRKREVPPGDAEVRARLRLVLRSLERLDALCRAGGWERNVPYLASLEDARAVRRLEWILADVVDREEVVPWDSIREWWTEVATRVRWDPEADRFFWSLSESCLPNRRTP